MNYVADFETTTDINDCRVWAYGVCSIDENLLFTYGNNLDDFFEWIKTSDCTKIYFHNLKFDGEFLIYYLFKQGFEFVKNRTELKTKTFTTLISDKGQFYSMKIVFSKNKHKTEYVEIFDSLKLLPFKVSEIAKGFNLPIQKGELDYKKYREPNHKITDEELLYIKNDCEIVARALHILLKENLTKMTIGSNALFDYKNIIGKKKFERDFPILKYDSDIRKSYKGGYTYLDKKYAEKELGAGVVFDVNSLYPYVMRTKKFPYGNPIFFKGKYEKDNLYDLYVQQFTCNFELKDGFIPTIQARNRLDFFRPNDYLESSNGIDVTLTLTSSDFELFKKHYNIYNIDYICGYKFKSAYNLFSDYIDKWIEIKNNATIEGNFAMRTLAKLMLNSLYGKFALNPNVCSKYPYLENDVVKYKNGEKELRSPIYIPIGSYITSYARCVTINSAQTIRSDFLTGKSDIDFVYADTDSLHCISPNFEPPKTLEIDPIKLGAWKWETDFSRAKFLRQKCYIEMSRNHGKDEEEKLKITCAGMPEMCYTNVSFDNFNIGAKYDGKLCPKHTIGGIILADTEFTIRKT